jgi:tRNA(Ile)-lysidine synthase
MTAGSFVILPVSKKISMHLPPPSSSVLVALSGGADSVALLLMLHDAGYRLGAAHCNFHLRGEESLRDEAFCRTLCRRLQVPLLVKHFDTTAEAAAHGESIEMAARRLRYAWFEACCEEEGYDVIAVAHHRNDNVETFLLNLTRGTGIHGLTGMRPQRGRIVRPLLDTDRAEILRYLEERGQDFVVDSTNSDTRYKRNYIRHQLMPALRRINPSIDKTLTTVMHRLAAVEEVYHLGVERALHELLLPVAHGYRLALSAVSHRAVVDALGERFGWTEDMVAHLWQWQRLSERAVFESDDYLAVVRRGWLEVTQRPPRFAPVVLPSEGRVALPDGRVVTLRRCARAALSAIPRERHRVALDADALHGPLVYRAPLSGERLAPYGMRGTKAITDYLSDRGYTAPQRLWARVIADTDGVLWLAGERPDRRGILTDATQQVVVVEWEDVAAS